MLFFFFNKKKKNSQSSNVLNMDSLILQREFSLVKRCLHFILLAMPEWNICAGSGMRGGSISSYWLVDSQIRG